MTGAFDRLLLPALNHLVHSENWAQERLRHHARAQVVIVGGPAAVRLRITDQGLFAAGDASVSPDVTLTLPADAPVRMLLDRSSLFSAVRLDGAADIAETLAFVFRNLRWDAEGDLAKLIGDIPAYRLGLVGRSIASGVAAAFRKVADNIAEYALEDSQMLVPPRDLSAFSRDLLTLQNELAKLEQRVARIGG